MKIFRGCFFFLIYLKWLIVLLLLFPILQFVSYSGEPDVEWEKLLDRHDGKVFCFSGGPTNDGGYIAGGYFSPDDYHEYVYLIKTDSLGNKVWDKIYEEEQIAFSVCQTVDGGYIITGYGPGVYLMKTDSLGNILWGKNYNGSQADEVCNTIDGGYIVVGMSITLDKYSLYLLKTDSLGNMDWEKTFSSEKDERGISVKQTNDGGYILTGYTSSLGAGDNDLYLVKTDNLGNQEWYKTFGNYLSDIGRYVCQTNDYGYIIVGSTNQDKDIYLIKTDVLGNTQWQKIIRKRSQEIGTCVRQTNDGGYILTGVSLSNDFWGEQDTYIVKTNNVGDIEWEKILGYGIGHDYGCSVYQTADGGYFIASYTQTHGIYLIKLGPDKVVPPSNDNFANASEIWGSLGKVTGTNVNATKERGEPNHCGNQGGKSVWYKWQAPASGPCFFDTYGSTFDTLLAIYSGNFVNALRHIASNDDDEGSPQSLVSFDVRAESEYNIAIDGKNGDSGNIVLSWILNSIDVTTPFPGDDWLRGTVNDITWATTGSPGSDVRITLWKNNQFYSAITCNTENDGSYPWRIPTSIPIGSDYKIRVTSNSNNKIYDFVDSNFSISEPLRVTSPNGKEDWRVGKMKHITWDSSDKIGSSVRITLWKGNQYYTTIIRDTLNTGSYFWTIPKSVPPGSDYRVRITSNSDYSIYDFSDNYFTISSLITVTSPNGGENWLRGTSKNITWTTTADVNLNVRITIWKDNQYFTTITNGTENDGTYCWTIPKTLPTGSDYRIRITSLLDESVYDFSDDYFSIKFGIIVTSPNGGENWQRGMTKEITWTSDCGENSYVNITLWKGGTLYLTIINHTQDSGSYSWAIPSSMLVGSDYKIRITSTSDSTIFDLSDNYFSITPGVL